ncbi:MAG: hypothetical protein V4449_02330 [Patescibacteria group bacterium]
MPRTSESASVRRILPSGEKLVRVVLGEKIIEFKVKGPVVKTLDRRDSSITDAEIHRGWRVAAGLEARNAGA